MLHVSLVVQVDASWYPNSGATNHLTHVSPAPQITTAYTRPCKVLVGNGTTFRISAIDTSVIPIYSKPLHLNNMLCTTCVTKNLLSVSQFSKENQVYFEFHASHCHVKDSVTNRALFQIFEQNGLYKLDLYSFIFFYFVPQSVTSVVTPATHLAILPSLAESTSVCDESSVNSCNKHDVTMNVIVT